MGTTPSIEMKAMHMHFAASAFSCLSLGLLPAGAITISLDLPSPTAPGFGAHLYNPGPALLVPGAPAGFEVDAVSYGSTGPIGSEFYFSVAPGSVGAPGTAVAGEALFADEAADIFVSTGLGFNTQYRDGNGIIANPLTPGAGAPGLGLIEGPFGDNVDGLDLRVIGPMVYWSVNPATAAGPYGGASAADIFMAPTAPGYAAGPAMYAPAVLLGLLAGDDIDAMVYFEDAAPGPSPGDRVLFSLAPGSPSLGPLGATPGDILITAPGGAPGMFMPFFALGLAPGDNLDALDVIPEPGQWMLFSTALLGCAMRRRRV